MTTPRRPRSLLVLTALLAAVAAACSDPAPLPSHLAWVTPHDSVPEPGLHDVTVTDTRAVVPGPNLPAQVVLGQSRNNLDVVRHQGRVYLAFRTAADHFANPDTVMYVVSSADEVTWDYEYEVALGTDIREPRLLSTGSRLFFFFSVLGTDPLMFQPMGVRVVEKTAAGWGPIQNHATDDRIVWRTRMHGGQAYMTSYTGGEHIYLFDGGALDVQFLTSADGVSWSPVGTMPSIYSGGASETDFAWDSRGDLWFVLRTEAWDPSGTGSKICVARGGDVDHLYCRSDPKKYDSPLVFEHDGEIYLIGRRNLTADGYYANSIYVGLSWADVPLGTVILDQGDYQQAAKRCSLWRIDRSEYRVAYLLDLPSNGDTCFASVIDGPTPDQLVVYNYSSDPAGPDLSWVAGQNGPTNIYRHVLQFTRR